MSTKGREFTSQTAVLREPTLHLYVYYLAQAAGDSLQDRQGRRTAFESEVWRALAAMGHPDRPALPLDKAVARDARIELYRTGRFPFLGGGGWLFAYCLNDSYLLRLTIYLDGERSLKDLATLASDLGWEANPHLSNYLGTSAYYCATVSPPQAKVTARQLLKGGRLWSERTPWGVLYGGPSPAGPFVLFYPHADAERAADDFFDRVAPELEWYVHKVQAQARQVEMGLRPVLEALEDALRAEGRAVRHLYTRLMAGETDVTLRFAALLDRLEGLLIDYAARIEETAVAMHGLRINEQNLRYLLAQEGLESGSDDLFARRARILSRASRQVKSDLGFHRPLARQTSDLLARLRVIQGPSTPAGKIETGLPQSDLPRPVSNPDLVIQHPGISLGDEEKTLLRRLFAPYTHLSLLTQFAGGFSKGRVFLALPARSDDLDAYTVVKLGTADAILREFSSYQTFVADKLPPITARIQHPPVVQGLRGGLRYTFVGGLGDDSPLQNLEAYTHARPATDIAKLVGTLFDTFGQWWWKARHPHSFWVWEEYDRWLPPYARVEFAPEGMEPARALAADSPADPSLPHGQCLRLEGFTVDEVDGLRERLLLVGREATGRPGWRLHLKAPRSQAVRYVANQQLNSLNVTVYSTRMDKLQENARRAFPDFRPDEAHFQVSGEHLPNPLRLLNQVLGQHVRGSRAIIHGDLNMGNILVGPGNLPWLIDFAWTRRGHTLLDFAWLEVHLVTRIVARRFGEHAPPLEPAALLVVLRWLETDNLEQPPPFEHRPQQEAAVMLAAVRRVVRQCLFDQRRPQEHRWPLVICYLSALRFQFPDEAEGRALSKQLALVAAAFLLQRWPVK